MRPALIAACIAAASLSACAATPEPVDGASATIETTEPPRKLSRQPRQRAVTTLASTAAEVDAPAASQASAASTASTGAESRLPTVVFNPAPIYPELEEAALTAWLEEAKKTLGADDPFIKAAIGDAEVSEVVKRAISETKLKDVNERKMLLDGGADAVIEVHETLAAGRGFVDPGQPVGADRQARVKCRAIHALQLAEMLLGERVHVRHV